MLKKKSSKRKAYKLDQILTTQAVIQKAYLLIERQSPKYQEYAPYICIWYDRITPEFVEEVLKSKRKVFYATNEVKEALDEYVLDDSFVDKLQPVSWLSQELTPASAVKAGSVGGGNIPLNSLVNDDVDAKTPKKK